MRFPDTIYALSSGRLPSGVGVVRLSGSRALPALEALGAKRLHPREMTLRTLRDASGGILDTALVVIFPAPRSFTGEDCAEIHVHGGRAVVAALLNALGSMRGLRHAEPGEFTRRAFLNGKLDLPASEALADLISAETEAQRRFAVANADGAQGSLYAGWRSELIRARAVIEAELDFADESDIPEAVAEGAGTIVRQIIADLERHIAGFRRTEIVRDGYNVVIVGAPNSGKSSLLNALAGRDVAIVTEEAGTTRDLLSVTLDLDGLKIVVWDTAGIRDDAGRIEQIGIDRARSAAARADLLLELVPVGTPANFKIDSDAQRLKIISKSDLAARVVGDARLRISTVTGQGIDALLEAISRYAAEAVGSWSDVLPSRQRHVGLLTECLQGLLESVDLEKPLELRAEDLRSAGEALGRITGAIDVEDLLDSVFSSFCVGK